MITQLFGLSAAETRVAERLMMGDSPEQAATTLSIKTSTARWHLASLYRKTGTSRQAQLVRLLLSLPMM
jgi:DNA-binding CsgD family transcriptional regulator